MNERDSGGGGMTGATGDLTPDAMPGEFQPAELREVSNPKDPAESRPIAEPAPRPDRDPWVGGDEKSDHEEHF
jgi:hypothetical protein